MQTKDGQKGRNRPKSLADVLLRREEKKDDLMVFDSPAAFEEARNRAIEALETR